MEGNCFMKFPWLVRLFAVCALCSTLSGQPTAQPHSQARLARSGNLVPAVLFWSGVTTSYALRSFLAEGPGFHVAPEVQGDRLPHLSQAGTYLEIGGTCIQGSPQEREWSSHLAVTYHLQEVGDLFAPYVGLGAGTHFLQASKSEISDGPMRGEDSLPEVSARRSLKKPGVFGAMGLRFAPWPTTVFFLQARCAVLLGHGDLVVGASPLSDWVNISTGLRWNLN